MKGERGDAVLVFFLASVLFFSPLLLTGRVLLPLDPATVAPWSELRTDARGPSNPLALDGLVLTLPARLYNHAMLRSGRIPFWNPHVFCGYPHFALIQNNVLYPLSLPFDLVDPAAGIGYSLCLHLGLAGSLMFFFLRRTGLGTAAAIVGGLAFEFNGMFLLRLSVPSYVYSGTWLPLMLIGADRIAGGAPVRRGWPLAAGAALSILGGHPQITIFALLVTLLYGVWRASVRALAVLVLLIGAGAALAAYQLVPFLELLRQSARASVPLALYRHALLPAVGLLQAILPDVFGNPMEGTYTLDRWAGLLAPAAAEARVWALNYIGENLYTGLPTLLLALVAIARSRRPETVFWGGLALGSLAVALGTPLLDLAYWLVPGMRYARPDRVLFIYMAAVPVLAALGYEAAAPMTTPPAPGRGRLVLALLAGAVLVWSAAPLLLRSEGRAGLGAMLEDAKRFWLSPGARLLEQAGAALVAVLATAAVVRMRRSGRAGAAAALACALALVPNLLFGWRFNPPHALPRLGETEAERILVEGAGRERIARILSPATTYLPANTAQMLRLDDVHGASAAALADYARLIRAADPGAITLDKYFDAFRDPAVAESPLLDLLGVGYVLSDHPLSLPRILDAKPGGVSIYRNPRAHPRFFVASSAEPADAAAAPALPSSVTVESDEAESVRLRLSAPAGGILVSSRVYYPGWEGLLDGRRVPAIRVNTAFLGLPLPPGDHEVGFVFVPRSFHLGLAISALALIAAGLAGAVTRVTGDPSGHE
jgi:Bacterial membrane protein YfhO